MSQPSVIIDLGHFEEDFKKNINGKLPKANEAVANIIEAEVKKAFTTFPKPPIKTGNLRRNIKAQQIDGKWQVIASTPVIGKKGGKEVEYAKFVEYGTVKMAPRPFFKTGVLNSTDKILKVIERMFKF